MRFAGRLLALGVALVGLGAQGCSQDKSDSADFVPPGAGGEPPGLVVTPSALPPHHNVAASDPNAGKTMTLPNGGEVHTVVVDGVRYVPIEATFSDASW